MNNKRTILTMTPIMAAALLLLLTPLLGQSVSAKKPTASEILNSPDSVPSQGQASGQPHLHN